MKPFFLSTICILLFVGCQTEAGRNPEQMTMYNKGMAPASEEGQNYDGHSAEITVQNQKIIRNGNMNITVKNALQTRKEINVILEKHKAYTGNEQLDNNDYQISYTLQIRVPAASLDGLIADLESMDGTVTFKSIQARDVTEEFIDLETRLTNKKSYLEQYRLLLKNARTIEDILKVRESIRQLEEEIESFTGRLKYLSNQVDLSTLDLSLTEKKDYVFRPDYRINFMERLKDSLSGGWHGFIIFCLALFRLWPFWIVGAGLIFLWRRSRRSKALGVK